RGDARRSRRANPPKHASLGRLRRGSAGRKRIPRQARLRGIRAGRNRADARLSRGRCARIPLRKRAERGRAGAASRRKIHERLRAGGKGPEKCRSISRASVLKLAIAPTLWLEKYGHANTLQRSV